MSLFARLTHAEAAPRSETIPVPLKPFTLTGDEATLRAELSAAIGELNVAARAFSSSKSFCREYLDLIRQAEGYAAERRWGEAHRTHLGCCIFCEPGSGDTRGRPPAAPAHRHRARVAPPAPWGRGRAEGGGGANVGAGPPRA